MLLCADWNRDNSYCNWGTGLESRKAIFVAEGIASTNPPRCKAISLIGRDNRNRSFRSTRGYSLLKWSNTKLLKAIRITCELWNSLYFCYCRDRKKDKIMREALLQSNNNSKRRIVRIPKKKGVHCSVGKEKCCGSSWCQFMGLGSRDTRPKNRGSKEENYKGDKDIQRKRKK